MHLRIAIFYFMMGLFCVACSSVTSHEIYDSESGPKIPINQWQSQ